VSSKEGMFFEESGHDSREFFFCEFLAEIFFCCGRTYCTDPYNLYKSIQSIQSYGFGTKIEKVWAQILRQISVFCSLFLGRTEQFVQLTMGMENEAEVARQQYSFGTKNKVDFYGTNLVL
jgi:hypothetical protein